MPTEVDISKIELPNGNIYNLKSGTKGAGEVDISKIVLPDGTICNIKGGSLTTKSITSNGIYNALSDSADGYSEVTVAVPNTYSSSDNGKVVQNGALVSQTTRTVTSNGTYNTTTNNSTVVNVQASSTIKTATITPGSHLLLDSDNESTAIQIGSVIGVRISAKLSSDASALSSGWTIVTISGINISDYANKTLECKLLFSDSNQAATYMSTANLSVNYTNEIIRIKSPLEMRIFRKNMVAGYIYWS